MEFSRPEYWSGQPFPSPVDLPDPAIEPGSPALQADSLPTELLGKTFILARGDPFQASDLERGIAPLGSPVPVQPLLLGGGVAPPGCSPWPRAWGRSSGLPPLTSDTG